MNAIILAIGDELTLGQTVDTNTPWIAAQLATRGISCLYHHTIPDQLEPITNAITAATQAAPIVIITGGLGPTEDDLTRHAIAAALNNVPLVLHQPSLDTLQSFFTTRNKPMAKTNRIQVMFPQNTTPLPNPRGTAPGIHAVINNANTFTAPGVPSEMRHMFTNSILPIIDSLDTASHSTPRRVILTSKINTFGQGESTIAQSLAHLTARDRNPTVGTTVSHGLVSIRIRSEATTTTDAQTQLDETTTLINDALGDLIFGNDDQTLHQTVAQLLTQSNQTIATAESCTAGLIAKLLTDPPGSSAYFQGGFVVYSNTLKNQLLEIPLETLNTHGAVSEQTATLLSENARLKTNSTFALATTGIAGPTGDTPDKPIGTVYISLAQKDQPTITQRLQLHGQRHEIRDRAAKSALNLLRLQLIKQSQN